MPKSIHAQLAIRAKAEGVSLNALVLCVSEGPQMVTRRGTETAVLVTIKEWRRLQAAARPSLKQLLLSDSARTDSLVPERGKARRRQAMTLR